MPDKWGEIASGVLKVESKVEIAGYSSVRGSAGPRGGKLIRNVGE